MNLVFKDKKAPLIIWFLGLYVLMPKPVSLPNFHFIGFSALLLLMLIHSAYMFYKDRSFIYLIKEMNRLFATFALILVVTVFAMVVHIIIAGFYVQLALFYLRQVFFLLVASYFILYKLFYKDITDSIVRTAWFLLIVQIVIVTFQYFNINIFSFIYDDFKTHGRGGILRLTGTLYNPNYFAWITSWLVIIIYVLSSKRTRYLAILFGAILVIFSGSRTHFVLFPLELVFTFILMYFSERVRISKEKFLRALLILISSIILVLVLFYVFQDYFPYMKQILNIFQTGDLRSVSSMNLRVEMWENRLSLFTKMSDWIWGVPPYDVSHSDNDIIYILNRSGIYGLVVYFIIYTISLFSIVYVSYKRQKISKFALLYFSYFLFMLFTGFVSEAFGSWDYPILLYILASISISSKVGAVSNILCKLPIL